MKQRIKVEGSCLDYVWRQAKPIEMKVMQNGLILSFPDSDVLVHWGEWLCEGDDGAWYTEGGDGHSEVMMFADKMRDVRIDYNEKVKASWQDYDYIERFAHLAKAHLQGDKTAASELWQMLSSERNDLLAYAMTAGGGCGKQRAEELADAAIMRVFEQTISGRRAIPSPRASMRTEIRKKIILKRDEHKFNIEIESAIVDSEGHCKCVRRLDHR